MIEFLNNFLMQPLVLIFQSIYDGIQLVVHNKGSALFVLSLVTVFLMIPLERAVRGSVTREKLTESILAPQIKSINQQYKGAERNAALKRLYSRYRYNPLSSVKATFSILVQLPFLFGAYWMLSGYKQLEGFHYSFIKDLSQPDALLFGLNLLPIVMTAINLATTAISGFSKKEATQAIIIALLFLILLYQAPAALLLYWTTNNLIHFLRAVYKRLQARKYANALKTHSFAEKLISAATSKVRNISSQTKVCSVLLILIAVFKLITSVTHKNGWTIATYLTTALLLYVLAKSVIESLRKGQDLKTLSKVIKLLSLVFSIFTILKITAFAVLDATKHHLGQYALISAVLLLMSSNTEKFAHGIKLFAWKYLSKEQRAINAGWTKLGIISVAIAYVSCFVIVPMRFYVQNMTELWFTGSSLAAYVAIAAIAVFLFLYYVVSRVVIPKKLSIFLLMLSTCVVFQNFLWPQQVKEFIGYDFDWLRSPLSYVNLAIWLAILTLGFYVCFKKKIFRQAVLMFDFLIIATVSVTTWQQQLNDGEYDSSRDTLAFDKTGMFDLGKENIIVFLLDTVSEESMEELYRTDKVEFEDIFKGFTWYHNNVGSGPVTSYAIPYIFTNVFPYPEENYQEYINRAYLENNYLKLAKKNKWDIRLYSFNKMFSGNNVDLVDNAKRVKNYGYANIATNNALYTIKNIGLYGGVFDLIRSKIKLDSNYFNLHAKARNNINEYHINDPLFYEEFKKNNGFKKTKKEREFIFYHLNGTHPPYRVDINGKWISRNQPNASERDTLLGCLRQFDLFLNNLKNNKLFDSSIIVLMSDHGKHFKVKSSFPILFVKQEYDNENLKISNLPVSHKNLLYSLIINKNVQQTNERVVMDNLGDFWKASLNVNNIKFEHLAKYNHKNSEYTTKNIGVEQEFITAVYQNATINFNNNTNNIIKFVFTMLHPLCDGKIKVIEGNHESYFFIGKNERKEISYKMNGNNKSVKLVFDCKIDWKNYDKSPFPLIFLEPQNGKRFIIKSY